MPVRWLRAAGDGMYTEVLRLIPPRGRRRRVHRWKSAGAIKWRFRQRCVQRTYWMDAQAQAQPAAGHEAMTIGIEQFREPRDLDLDRLLVQPLRGGPGPYAINRPQAGP